MGLIWQHIFFEIAQILPCLTTIDEPWAPTNPSDSILAPNWKLWDTKCFIFFTFTVWYGFVITRFPERKSAWFQCYSCQLTLTSGQQSFSSAECWLYPIQISCTPAFCKARPSWRSSLNNPLSRSSSSSKTRPYTSPWYTRQAAASSRQERVE